MLLADGVMPQVRRYRTGLVLNKGYGMLVLKRRADGAFILPAKIIAVNSQEEKGLEDYMGDVAAAFLDGIELICQRSEIRYAEDQDGLHLALLFCSFEGHPELRDQTTFEGAYYLPIEWLNLSQPRLSCDEGAFSS